MVCTGDTLIFGIQLGLIDVVEYMLKYLKIKHLTKTFENAISMFENYSDDNLEISEQLNEIFKKLKLSIEIIKPRCCLFSSSDEFSYVYLGVELCSNYLVSRFNVKEFDTILAYENFYTERLVQAKKTFEKNKSKYIKDISKFVDLSKHNPKFYTLPNDCFYCT